MVGYVLLVASLDFVYKRAKLGLVNTQHSEDIEVTHAVSSQEAECFWAANFFHERENVEVELVCVLELFSVALFSQDGERILCRVEI